MYPDHQDPPVQPNYDFILNPPKPPKPKVFGGPGNSFVTKIVILVGGAVLVIVVLALIVNFVFGSKTNLDTVVSLAQTEQEVVRLGTMGKDATGQPIKNASISTALTIKSHQQNWIVFLSKHGRKVDSKILGLKKDTATDTRLKAATQTSTFDPTYTAVMRTQLSDYATSLKTAYQGATNQQERTLLNSQYKDVQLLLAQWPN